MNVGTPLWTAIIAAISALLGIWLGQHLQTRRENRNWVRQRAQEDQHRFTDSKRQVYAKYIAKIDDYSRLLHSTAFVMQIDKNAQGPYFDIATWMRQRDYDDRSKEITDDLSTLRAEIALLGDQHIVQGMKKLNEAAANAIVAVRTGQPSDSAELDEFVRCKDELLSNMKDDLT